MTLNSKDLINVRQVALLLGYNPRRFPYDNFGKLIMELPEPVQFDPDLWSLDQVRDLIATAPRGKSKERVNLEDTELLRTGQIAKLHNPPIMETTANSYYRRTQRRNEEGKTSANPFPDPVKNVFGHPLWDPADVGRYLVNRPGSGWFKGTDEDRRYRKGRGGWRKNKAAVPAESVPS